MEQRFEPTNELLDPVEATRYLWAKKKGQRKLGPPLDYMLPPPPKGCEIFVGNLPQDMFEDELFPIFAKCGMIYKMNIMVHFSGFSRGFAFITYTNESDAARAIKIFNGYQVRHRRYIVVAKAFNNCRLYISKIPKTLCKGEVYDKLTRLVPGIIDIILYNDFHDRRLNREYAFVEFESHHAAAVARRTLLHHFLMQGRKVDVNWAAPEPNVDDAIIERVKVLHVKNLWIWTTPDTLKYIFETAINANIEKITKRLNFAFVHFYNHADAELAMEMLQNFVIDECIIDINWARCYCADLEQNEHAYSSRDDWGIGSGYGQLPHGYQPDINTVQNHTYSAEPSTIYARRNSLEQFLVMNRILPVYPMIVPRVQASER